MCVCKVVCVAHSCASIEGRPGPSDKSYWVALVKDVEQKGYFIKIVDREVSHHPPLGSESP